MSEHQEEVESALANLRETQALYAKMEGFVKEKRQSVLARRRSCGAWNSSWN